MGSVVLVALAGAHRTDTAVSGFVQYAGPTEAQVAADPRTMDKIASLPSVAYTSLAAFMLAVPVTGGGRIAVASGQVTTFALIHRPPESRAVRRSGLSLRRRDGHGSLPRSTYRTRRWWTAAG